jgi:ariadne-1
MADDEDLYMEDSMDEDGYYDDDVEDEDEEEEEEDTDFFAPVVADKDIKKPYEVDFKVYSVQDIRNFQDQEVKHVSGILGCLEPHAATLLRHYHWNKERLIERYMDNPDDVLADAGVILDSSKQPRFVPMDGFECSICYNDEPGLETLALSCGHRFCKDCYTRYLTQKITEEGESRRIQCLDSNCKLIVDEKTVELTVPFKVLDKYVNVTVLKTPVITFPL